MLVVPGKGETKQLSFIVLWVKKEWMWTKSVLKQWLIG